MTVLLNGYDATSDWSVRHVSRFGAMPTDARVVRARTHAECCQLRGEYYPHHPFNFASMKTALAEIKEPVVPMLAQFTKTAEELPASTKG